MCGVFGFASKNGSPVRLRTLRTIAKVTQSRGRHAWGIAWIDGRGRLSMFKQTGPVGDALGLLAMARDARFLIGHCRWATQGDPADNANNHPHPADGGWIVHNGVIDDYADVVRRNHLHPTSACDSEILGLLINQAAGLELIDRCVEAVVSVRRSPLVLLGLWKPGRLVAVRQGNPLHVGETADGFYLGSLAFGLPGQVSEAADNEAYEYGDQPASVPAL